MFFFRFVLHGGPLREGGLPHPELQYKCVNEHMWTSLLAASVQLVDHNPGDGGFCCIPGSHKANFFCSWEMRRLEVGEEHVRHIPAKAGSAILFTEALTHGALPWNGEHERRLVILRYGPGIMAFSPPAAPETLAEIAALSPLHAALLKPPSFPERSDFPALLEDAQGT